jgi:hypothetical protein
LEGRDWNRRWLNAAASIFEVVTEQTVTLQHVDKQDLYTIPGVFDVITMFGFIYGHHVDVARTFQSVCNALPSNGLYFFNDKTYPPAQIQRWLSEAGLNLVEHITVMIPITLSSNFYIATKHGGAQCTG